MIRSMYSAISGLRAHQTMMDVVGNNIANVNTHGFKSSNALFEDIFDQNIRGAGAGTVDDGGTNPNSIGLGTKISAVTTSFSQGSFQTTGRATDFAIGGDGFFVINDGGVQTYSRSGSFSIDSLGRLVTQSGGFVQGWQAAPAGEVEPTAPLGNLSVPVGDLVEPLQTTTVTAGGNLPADATIGTTLTSAVNVFDAQGKASQLRLEFAKTGTDQWDVTARYIDPNGALVPAPPAAGQALGSGTLTFNAAGELTSSYDLTLAPGLLPEFTTPVTISLGDATSSDRINQFGKLATLAIIDQDGYASGSLAGFAVSQEGLLVGTYSNGQTRAIGQMAMASFANPEGLQKNGGTTFRETVNSGLPRIGVAGVGGRGLMQSGALEMSNVDLGREFTNLIVAQRGFQANSRVITTSDEMLQELVNMKR